MRFFIVLLRVIGRALASRFKRPSPRSKARASQPSKTIYPLW